MGDEISSPHFDGGGGPPTSRPNSANLPDAGNRNHRGGGVGRPCACALVVSVAFVAEQNHAADQEGDVAEAADGVPASAKTVLGLAFVGTQVLRGVQRACNGRGDPRIHPHAE